MLIMSWVLWVLVPIPNHQDKSAEQKQSPTSPTNFPTDAGGFNPKRLRPIVFRPTGGTQAPDLPQTVPWVDNIIAIYSGSIITVSGWLIVGADNEK